MKRILFIAACMLCLPTKVQASFWLECKVIATLEETSREGVYYADIHKAIVTNGHVEKNSTCIEGNIGKTIEIKIHEDNIPTGKKVNLKYSFYNGRGDEGVVNEESWSLWKPKIRDMLPW